MQVLLTLFAFFACLLASDIRRDNYFDIYSPVHTRYSQVSWTKSDRIPLPEHIVARFHGKVMTVTGYEVDQVTRTPEGDKSFPVYHAYNHHYSAWLLSEDSTMVRLNKPVTPKSLTSWIAQDKTSRQGAPASITLPRGQIGTQKKPHWFPSAQLIHSPSSFHVEPLQIDTHNREYKGPGYKPWFLPKSANTSASQLVSPLVNCPCTDRVTKLNSPTLVRGTCQKPITSAQACFTEAKSVAELASATSVHDMTLPAGCSISPVANSNAFAAVFNSAPSVHSCAAAGNLRGRTTSLVDLTVIIDPTAGNVNIIMAGQNGVWFGVGFGAEVMADAPYTIVVDGAGVVTEHKIANHDPGVQLDSTITVVSNTVSGTIRTVALTRAIVGKTSDYFTFPTAPTTINFIDAYGDTPDFEYHQDRTAAKLVLSPAASPTCVCEKTTQVSYMNQPAVPFNYVKEALQCCQHGWFLTDKDQEKLIPETVDEYFMKFRFYFEERK